MRCKGAHTEANAMWPVYIIIQWKRELVLLLNFWTTSRFTLKQLDYSLSISMRDSWFGLHRHQLSRDRNFERITVTVK